MPSSTKWAETEHPRKAPTIAITSPQSRCKAMLTVIDGVNVIVGCRIIGLVLMLF